MVASKQTPPSLPALIAIAVGNSRTRAGVFRAGDLAESWVEDNASLDAITTRATDALKAERQDAEPDPAVVIASVDPGVSDQIYERLAALRGRDAVYRVGRDLPIPIETALDESGQQTVGQDRLLSALGAYSIAQSACVVVDVGTAVTVDFVDGEGTFQGGVIAPGVSMMLQALHERTAQLPDVAFERPPGDTHWGQNTPDAMRLGVALAVRGLVRAAAERYALAYGAYPTIIGTGGDIGVLEDEEIIEHALPDLQLLGIREACARALAPETE